MNILVDCHVFDGKFQGTRTYLEGLYKEMVKYEDINFFFAAQDIDNLKMCFGEGENIHYVALKSSGKFKRLAWEFPSIIKQIKIDYAHYQYISPLYKACKEVVTIHDLLFLDMPEYFPWSYQIKNKYLFRRSAKRADILLTVSEFSKDEIIRHFNIPADQICITYNGVLLPDKPFVDTDIRQKYFLDRYIMTVSRIEPRKNHLALLKAYTELKLYLKGYKLIFVGGYDWSNKEFEDYYKNLSPDVKPNVIITTASYSELVDLYKHASLFVFPSFGEGFGIPPIEAIAFDCPLLCSNLTAMSEYELPSEMNFDPCNIDELKNKIERLLNNPQDQSMVKKSILKKYNWEKSADALYNILIKS